MKRATKVETGNEPIVIITIHADPSMPPGIGEWGGTHAYMRELLSGLARKGRRCVLITRRVNRSLKEKETITELSTVYRIEIGPVGLMDKKYIPNYHEETKAKIKKIISELSQKPKLLHSVYWNSGKVAMELSDELAIPYVHSVISNSIRKRKSGGKDELPERESTERMIYEKASKILCVARSEKKDIIDLYDISPEKIIVAGQDVHETFIYPSHDEFGRPYYNNLFSQRDVETIKTSLADTIPINQDNFKRNFWIERAFIYIGRITKDKGVDHILRAWNILYLQVADICPPLWLVGGSPDEIASIRNEVLTEIPSLPKLEQMGKIFWWGYLSESGISTLLLKSLVLVTHSKYEPGGRVIVEAMSAGIPVIATPNGFALDYVKNWYNGFLTPFGDVMTVAKRMKHFVYQPLLRNTLGMTAKETAAAMRDEWNFINRHCEIYDTVQKSNLTDVNMPLIDYAPKKIHDAFAHRTLSTYPFNDYLIKDSQIKAFIETTSNHQLKSIKKANLALGSSLFWLVQCEDSDKLIKHPCTRLALTAIWNPYERERIVLESQKRFQTEIFSSDLPGIAPIISFCSELRLLMRNQYSQPQIDFSIEMVLKAVSPIRKLQASSIDLSSIKINEFKKNLQDISLEEMQIISENIKKNLSASSKPWDTHKHFSARLAWRQIECMLTEPSIEYELSPTWIDKTKKFRHKLHALSEFETIESITLCHGSTEYFHLVIDENEEMLLIDGEHIHPAWPGEDIAVMLISIANLIVEPSEEIGWWEKVLTSVPSNDIERSLILSWIGLLTMEELIRNSSMLNLEKTKYLMKRFESIERIFDRLV